MISAATGIKLLISAAIFIGLGIIWSMNERITQLEQQATLKTYGNCGELLKYFGVEE